MTAAAALFDSPLFYRDARFDIPAAKLLPTQFHVVDTDMALVTVLGSCIAACIRDPVLRIGGMNHFMLPDGNVGDGAPARYGSYAMEMLLNAPSGDLFGMTQNAGMGWDPQQMAGPQFFSF